MKQIKKMVSNGLNKLRITLLGKNVVTFSPFDFAQGPGLNC